MISPSHFHPMLVHFPIALIALGFLAELASYFIKKEVCFSKIAFYLLITGTLSALFAWLTGILFTAEMSGSAGEIKEIHELFAWITLGLLLVTSALRIIIEWRKTTDIKLKWLAFSFYALAAVSVSITGYFGGTLVYSYMMPL
jgi:uncharacterized membrane protein